MSWLQNWKQRYAGSSAPLLIAAVGFTTSFYIGYKKMYQPWIRRRNMAEAEKFANILAESEQIETPNMLEIEQGRIEY